MNSPPGQEDANLDAEIARWENCSKDNADARAVLRAYLGVREVLWELGLRRPERSDEPGAASGPPRKPRRRRVQRVRIDG